MFKPNVVHECYAELIHLLCSCFIATSMIGNCGLGIVSQPSSRNLVIIVGSKGIKISLEVLERGGGGPPSLLCIENILIT